MTAVKEKPVCVRCPMKEIGGCPVVCFWLTVMGDQRTPVADIPERLRVKPPRWKEVVNNPVFNYFFGIAMLLVIWVVGAIMTGRLRLY